MAIWRPLFRGFSTLLNRRKTDQELNDEIEHYFEEAVLEGMARGLPKHEAVMSARRLFGTKSTIQAKVRESRWESALESFVNDIRYAVRRLARARAFTAVVIMTLALGIGVNTSIFSVFDAVMLRSLPVTRPDQLYRFGSGTSCCVFEDAQDNKWNIFSYPLYQFFRANLHEFSDLAAFEGSVMDLSVKQPGSLTPVEASGGEFVTANYFQAFGLRPFAGRFFLPAEDDPGASPVTVVSYRAWKERYGSDPSMVGRVLIIRGLPMTVVGIGPQGFFGDTVRTNPPSFWFPMSTEPQLHGSNSMIYKPGSHWLYIIGRLKPGISKEEEQAAVTLELQQWFSSQQGAKIAVGTQQILRRQSVQLSQAGGGIARMSTAYGSGLRLLIGISASVLLIACANIANLMMARSVSERMQQSLRIALGSTRLRLLQQGMSESLLLALGGGTLGLVVAYGGTRLMLATAFRGVQVVPISAELSLPTLLFCFTTSIAACILFGTVPAWSASKRAPADAIKNSAHSSGRIHPVFQRSLVLVQVALSIVLLVCAGALLLSLQRLEQQSFGFKTDERMLLSINPASAGLHAEQLPDFYRQLYQRLVTTKNVSKASFSLYSPLDNDEWDSSVFIPGQEPSTSSKQAAAVWNRVAPHYFETTGTPMLQGRELNESDGVDHPKVAVVNEAFATKYFPHQSVIGRRFGTGSMENANDIEVVGVAANARYDSSLDPISPMFFIPFLQPLSSSEPDNPRSEFAHSIEIETPAAIAVVTNFIRETLQGINPSLAVLDAASFQERRDENFNQERMLAELSGLFGFLALAIASVGIYGVVAYTTEQRKMEIGIRLALGASRKNVVCLVVRGALREVIFGTTAGFVLAFALKHWLSHELYGFGSVSPTMILLSALTLCLCACGASSIPAWRASKLDPRKILQSG